MVLATHTVTILFAGLCVLNAIYLWQEGKKLDLAEKIINSALIWLVVGIPLLFSSLTRSVFEVWKLLLLRAVIIVVFGTWITKRILFVKKEEHYIKPEETFSMFGISWQKTGLEWPFIVWGIINVVATIFSHNVYVSIIGAYDRWEGLVTVFNYIFLFFMIAKLIKTEALLHWILIAIFGSTALSAVYAIFQSLGMDFMHWSADPTSRTFACINNPVHYSAYIAMVVPLGMGWLLYSSNEEKISFFSGWLKIRNFSALFAIETVLLIIGLVYELPWLLLGSLFVVSGILAVNSFMADGSKRQYFLKLYTFIATLIIYYSMYISYGRGTWMGFAASMVFCYLIMSGVLYSRDKKMFILDFFVTIPVVGLFFVDFAFNLYKLGNKVLIPSLIIFALYLLFAFWMDKHWKKVALRFIIIWIFLTLPFVSVSLKNIALYFGLTFLYYLIVFSKDFNYIQNLNLERKRWLLTFLIIFGLVLVIPTSPTHLNTLFANKDASSRTEQNVLGKVAQLESQALHGSARTSMWKTSLGWGGVPYPYFGEKDGKFRMFLHSTAWVNGADFKEKLKGYPLLGTGPDTVKELYPTYRRSDYGRLEGGHNLTPDRVHDEYLNMLITTGFLGAGVNYLWIMGAYIIIVLSFLRRYENNPYFYLILGAFIGSLVYEGQVFFNFGVVATKVLFYVLMGFAISIGVHNIGWRKKVEPEKDNG
ncbi:O-antigen ligase family protein [Candidatus Margulisiibacteriota bacterium]